MQANSWHHKLFHFYLSFEIWKCGKEGKTGWSAVLEFLEFLELFLNCTWFLKNPWNNEFLRICSWNVLEFYFSSFIKNSAHLFHDSSFWNWCLYIGSSYYLMMLRLSEFCSCWYLYFMRFVFGYYEIKLFKKTLQINCYDIFNIAYVFEKYMFLKCSWITLEFSLQKSLATIEKITKIWISQQKK